MKKTYDAIVVDGGIAGLSRRILWISRIKL